MVQPTLFDNSPTLFDSSPTPGHQPERSKKRAELSKAYPPFADFYGYSGMQTVRPLPRINLTALQVIAWLIVYVLLILYSVQKWTGEALYGIVGATIYTGFYLLAVYTNSHFLLPRWFQRGLYGQYIALAIVFLIGSSLLRMEIEREVLFSRLNHRFFYNWSPGHFAFVFVTMFLALLFGFLLRIGLNYVALLRNQEELKSRHLQAELGLLKARVQPHFLFNTLNNLYYLAYSGSERTAEVIARLAAIMRYFVDEATREQVPLLREWQFVEDYIELEQLRLVYPLQVSVERSGPLDTVWIPPMLLIPLVENIFKHGVDRTRPDNAARIVLGVADSRLHVDVHNTTNGGAVGPWRSLGDLQKRLSMLFNDDYLLQTILDNGSFSVQLRCPLVQPAHDLTSISPEPSTTSLLTNSPS